MTTKIEKTELDLGLDIEPKKRESKGRRTRKITRPKRSSSILVRVFPEEKERIEALSKEHMLTPSEFIRSSALGNLTQSDIEALIEQRAIDKVETVKEQYFNTKIVSLTWPEIWGLKNRLQKELKKLQNKKPD